MIDNVFMGLEISIEEILRYILADYVAGASKSYITVIIFNAMQFF